MPGFCVVRGARILKERLYAPRRCAAHNGKKALRHYLQIFTLVFYVESGKNVAIIFYFIGEI